MKLNRSHALLLVGTIAAAGCVVENKGDDGNGGEGGDGAKGGTGNGMAGSEAGGKAGAAAGSAGKGSAGTSNTAGYAGAAGDGGGQGGEGGAEAGSAGSPAGGESAQGGAGGESVGPTCSDDALVEVSCEGLDYAACDIATFLSDECTMTAATMKPRISNIARQCMLDLSASALCDATNTYGCLDQALKSSCPDETAATSCDSIISACAEGGTTISAETCSLWLSGMTDGGRSEMVGCMTSSALCDFHTCAEGLVYPSSE